MMIKIIVFLLVALITIWGLISWISIFKDVAANIKAKKNKKNNEHNVESE